MCFFFKFSLKHLPTEDMFMANQKCDTQLAPWRVSTHGDHSGESSTVTNAQKPLLPKFQESTSSFINHVIDVLIFAEGGTYFCIWGKNQQQDQQQQQPQHQDLSGLECSVSISELWQLCITNQNTMNKLLIITSLLLRHPLLIYYFAKLSFSMATHADLSSPRVFTQPNKKRHLLFSWVPRIQLGLHTHWKTM